MTTWLPRTVSAAILACGIILATPAAALAAEPDDPIGMGAGLFGSTRLGEGAVGGTRGDVARPVENLVRATLPTPKGPGRAARALAIVLSSRIS